MEETCLLLLNLAVSFVSCNRVINKLLTVMCWLIHNLIQVGGVNSIGNFRTPLCTMFVPTMVWIATVIVMGIVEPGLCNIWTIV